MEPLKLSTRNRSVVALLISCAYAALAYARLRAEPSLLGRDFTYSWLGAKFLLAGQNPYVAMATAPSPYPGAHAMFYPLPAAVLALPTVWLSAQMAAAVFVAVGASLLAYAVTARGWWRLWIMAGAPAYVGTQSVQWSLLLTAGALIPGALGLVAAKPNLALPLAAYQRRWRDFIFGVIGGLLLVLVALMFRADWISNWLAMFGSSPLSGQYKIPIFSPWGCWLVLAALRWRDRDARLVLVMACAPQTSYLYDQLPLLLVARTRMQQIALALTSWCAYVLFLNSDWHAKTWNEYSSVRLPYVIVGVYLPALLIVLWPHERGSKDQRVLPVSRVSNTDASIEARAS